MFKKLIIYQKPIDKFKQQHGITKYGFPFDSFKSFYDYYGYYGMFGHFLKFVQDHRFLIVSNNKKVIVAYKGKIIYNKEIDHDPYDLVGRYWFGILICLKVMNEL